MMAKTKLFFQMLQANPVLIIGTVFNIIASIIFKLGKQVIVFLFFYIMFSSLFLYNVESAYGGDMLRGLSAIVIILSMLVYKNNQLLGEYLNATKKESK